MVLLKKMSQSPRSTVSPYNDETKNPCLAESKLALKCMNEHSDQSKCEPYYTNVRNCRVFWDKVRRDRKRAGIEPHLPLPEERAKIRKEFMARSK